jgi:integrase
LPVGKRKLSEGLRYRYRRMINGKWIRSRYVFLTSQEAANAEAEAVQKFLMTGQTPSTSSDSSETETVRKLLTRRLEWLQNHKSEKHFKDCENLFAHVFKFAPEWDTKPVTDVKIQDVENLTEKWAEDLVSRKKSRLTVNKALVALQAAWNSPWGSRRAERTYPYNPFAMIERFSVEKRAKQIPTEAQARKILNKAKGEGRIYLEFLKGTGARPGEARFLQWTDLNISQRPYYADLYTRKKKDGSRTPRRVPIDQDLAMMLRKWRKENSTTVYVFQQYGQEMPHDKHWATDVQKDACESAKVPYFTPHSWRHWHTSRLIKDKVDLAKVQKRLGHENFATTAKYVHELVGA